MRSDILSDGNHFSSKILVDRQSNMYDSSSQNIGKSRLLNHIFHLQIALKARGGRESTLVDFPLMQFIELGEYPIDPANQFLETAKPYSLI